MYKMKRLGLDDKSLIPRTDGVISISHLTSSLLLRSKVQHSFQPGVQSEIPRASAPFHSIINTASRPYRIIN